METLTSKTPPEPLATDHPSWNGDKVIPLLKKLNTIAQEVTYISDDKRVDFAKYSYASEEAIKKALAPKFREHGVIFFLDILGQEAVEKNLYISCVYNFVDTETGAKISGNFLGCGQDSADKALYKAITGALKYILTTTFLIPTGTDPEEGEPLKKERIPAAAKARFAAPKIPALEKRYGADNSKNPGRAYWYDTANQDFHSWADENPEADPAKGTPF